MKRGVVVSNKEGGRQILMAIHPGCNVVIPNMKETGVEYRECGAEWPPSCMFGESVTDLVVVEGVDQHDHDISSVGHDDQCEKTCPDNHSRISTAWIAIDLEAYFNLTSSSQSAFIWLQLVSQ